MMQEDLNVTMRRNLPAKLFAATRHLGGQYVSGFSLDDSV